MAEHDDLTSAVDDYLTRHYADDRRRKFLDGGGWDPGLAAELADLGWYSLAVSEDRGGIGASTADLGRVFLEYGRHLVIGPQMENSLLPALIGDLDPDPAGTPPALVDPGVTHDWAADYGSVSLNGQELTGTVGAVRFAAQAGVLVVVAGASVCLVDPTAPGVHIESVGSADPGTVFARVEFDAATADTVVVDGDLVTRLRAWARLLLACELSGIAQGALEHTVTYVGQREQFDRPIGGFQAVQHLAADMAARSTGLRNLCLATLEDARDASPTHLALLSSTAKAHAAATTVGVCEDAIQLHGGMGFTTETDVSWFYRRAMALRGWYGDETELQHVIGSTILTTERQM
ncbi:acyl-CoA dehydrogenase family protein [Pseudonocardia endophytica]|uniref:Alkylation response protein AidB-like acyl-CoA dehydrogenase n=1 Tax=Pseudonocardia endophytica TaxID=401976 RepID=A0A4R1HTB4_PSEEN|nr:acyl-CoA dehydrogenase family protein [Pseudonocardia endophytica]TCK24611.1 alkylation response protein AidB-like acyl-CoA dehydrogenase [Pseudonocardia endophytica]